MFVFVQRVWEESETQTEEEQSSEQAEVTRPHRVEYCSTIPVFADVALGENS